MRIFQVEKKTKEKGLVIFKKKLLLIYHFSSINLNKLKGKY